MTFNIVNPYRFAVGDVGAWKELGRTSVTSGTSLDVTGLANKKYLMTVNAFTHTSASRPVWQFNGVSTSSYAYRARRDNGADFTGDETTDILWSDGAAWGAGQDFMVSYIYNKDTGAGNKNSKVQIGWNVAGDDTGDANEPHVAQGTGDWDVQDEGETTVIDEIDYALQGLTSSFSATSEAIVLGYDPTDTHTDNFWEELGSNELSSAGTLDSGVFTTKKYLWFQAFAQMDSTTSDGTMKLRLNGNDDTFDTFASAYEVNGGGNVVQNNQTSGWCGYQVIRSPTGGCFVNGFILNDSSKEKLCYVESVNGDHPNNGASTAVYRSTSAIKCEDTTNITSVQLLDLSNNYSSGSWLKVWGAN